MLFLYHGDDSFCASKARGVLAEKDLSSYLKLEF